MLNSQGVRSKTIVRPLHFYFSAMTFSVGLAIFSMFFGAGNVVFPILLGQEMGGDLSFAMAGLLVTAIGGPLLGLLATILYKGDCREFFKRIGHWPGMLCVLILISLLGPFGAMPRCITVSYAAIQNYLPFMSLSVFSVLFGLLTLLCIIRREYILSILGYVLSPVLIVSLLAIIFLGLMASGSVAPASLSAFESFRTGLGVGFDTMDLLASIMFAVVIWDLLKEKLQMQNDNEPSAKTLIPLCSTSSIIGGLLLALMYVGLGFVAAKHASAIVVAEPERILSQLAINILGPGFGFVANLAVALACLTTVISLGVMVADVLHVEFKPSEKNWTRTYLLLVVGIMVLTVIFANFGFSGLMKYLHPATAMIYPSIIVLTLCNILYKATGFSYVKLPVYATFAATVVYHYV